MKLFALARWSDVKIKRCDPVEIRFSLRLLKFRYVSRTAIKKCILRAKAKGHPWWITLYEGEIPTAFVEFLRSEAKKQQQDSAEWVDYLLQAENLV